MRLLDIIIELPSHKEFNMLWLTDCTLLSKIFAAQITELQSKGHCQRRLVNMRGQLFIEKILYCSATELVYQIDGNGPVKDHQGSINYVNSSAGHYLHYQINGVSNTWVPTPLLRLVMFLDFKLAGKRLRSHLNER